MFSRLRKKKKVSEQYRNLVFVELEKNATYIEDDIEYLKYILDGSDGKRVRLRYRIVGVKDYSKESVLITLADVDITMLKDYIESYDGVKVV